MKNWRDGIQKVPDAVVAICVRGNHKQQVKAMRKTLSVIAFLLSFFLMPGYAQQEAGSASTAVNAAASVRKSQVIVGQKALPQDSVNALNLTMQKEIEEKMARGRELAKRSNLISPTEVIDLPTTPELRSESMKAMKRAPQRRPQRAPRLAPANLVAGQYMSRDSSLYSGLEGYAMQCFKDSTGQWFMSGIYGLADTISLVVDEQRGTVKVPPQVVYRTSSYTLYIYPFDQAKGYYYPTDSVSGTIAADGTITLGQWGLFAPTTDGSARVLDAFASSRWRPYESNADMQWLRRWYSSPTDTSYPVIVEQTGKNRIALINFANNGIALYGRITPDHRVIIAPQKMGTTMYYGDLYLYPTTDNTTRTADTKQNLVGTLSGDSLKFGPWVISTSTGNGRTGAAVNMRIKVVDSIAWPDSTTITFKGTGTAEDPYLLATADDIEALSEKVEDGDSYMGAHFKVTADIDMSAMDSHVPVGTTTTPFAGEVDGQGHTISGLNYSDYGASYSGLFGMTDSASVIKNLNISNFNLSGSGSYVGIVAGYSGGAIDSVNVTASSINVTGATVGGLAGYARGPIRDASFQGTVIGGGTEGGLAGFAVNEVARSHATANIGLSTLFSSTDNYAAGLVAVFESTVYTTAKMSECWFSGQIIDQTGGSHVGGLVSSMMSATMDRCFNVGAISTTQGTGQRYDHQTGGLIATVMDSKINDSYNAGTIIKSGSSDGVGGIVGYVGMVMVSGQGATDLSSFSNCYNSGYIISSPNEYNDHRGIWGNEGIISGYHPAENAFTNCYTDKQLTAMNDTLFGVANSTLLSGQLPAGFSSDVWTAKAGQYPQLKCFEGTTAASLSAAALAFASTDNSEKVKNDITISDDEGINTRLYNSTSRRLVSETDYFKISGTTLSPKSSFGSSIVQTYVGSSDIAQSKIVLLSAVPKVFKGDGTAASPYLITNKADLDTLNYAVFTAQQPFEGDYFLMTNDIDATGFSGIGTGAEAQTTIAFFQGDFNGGGHAISGMNVNSYVMGKSSAGADSLVSGYNYAGLFRVLGRFGHVHNLTLSADNTFNILQNGGAVVGYLEGKVDSVVNLANVYGYGDVIGGIAGQASELATISHSYNGGDIISGGQRIGGIVGVNYGTVEYSQNDGDITSAAYAKRPDARSFGYVGGIAGFTYGPLNYSVNNATVVSTQYVGGIAGTVSNTTLTGNLNTGTAGVSQANTYVGGIAGNLVGTSVTLADNAYDESINTRGAAAGSSRVGVTGYASTTMVSGNAIEGLDKSIFDYTAGQYPVLKEFAAQPKAIALRKAYIKFAEGEQIDNIRHQEGLSEADGLTWSLKVGVDYTVANNVLTANPIATDVLAKDTLVAKLDNVQKAFFLSAIPKVLPGDGTAESPFQIRTKADMDKVADFVSSTGTSFPGFYFRVLNDIDYKNDTLKLIAIDGNTFDGDFDGGKHTISNFFYENTTYYRGEHKGLFGVVGPKGNIHDLTLNGIMHVSHRSGTFVGLLNGQLRNVVNKGEITAGQSTAYLGGIVGEVGEGALVDSAFNEASFEIKGKQYVAGIAGMTHAGSTISNSGNSGNITSDKSAAGIVAYMQNGGNVINCYNTGTLTTTASSVAGIVGYVYGNSTFVIDSCYNTGAITASGYMGGILGNTGSGNTGRISHCWNTGELTGSGTTGGIAGYINQGVDLDSLYNTGNITSTNGAAAGIVSSLSSGNNKPMSVSNCWNTGNITGKAKVGGIFSDVSSNRDESQPVITDCWNLGDVTGTGTGSYDIGYGGIFGTSGGTATGCWNAGKVTSVRVGNGGLTGNGSGILHDCFNVGDVASDFHSSDWRANAGGLQGFGDGHFIDCYNMGNVTGEEPVAGINGGIFGEMVMNNVYQAGHVSPIDTTLYANFTNYSSEKYDKLDVANLYFDKTVSPETESDKLYNAVGLTPGELYYAEGLGDHFAYNRAAYPVLKAIKEPVVGNFYAASLLFIEGEDTTHVRNDFYVGMLDSVKWTSSDNITISDNGTCKTTATGRGWVKKTATFHGKTWERIYYLNIDVNTGISNVSGAEDAIGLDLTKPMYNLSGQRVGRDYRGVVIQKGRKYVKK